MARHVIIALCIILIVSGCTADRPAAMPAAPANVLKGQAAFGDWTTDAPGVRRLITVDDLPPPGATKSVDNGPKTVARPQDAWPKAPPGFVVELFAEKLTNPR